MPTNEQAKPAKNYKAYLSKVPTLDSECDYFADHTDCSAMFNCCDCGGVGCGCHYCWSCNACEHCLNNTSDE